MKIFIRGALLAVLLMTITAVVYADNVVEGFLAQGKLKPGQIVSLADNKTPTVKIAPANHSNEIYGVVVDDSKAPITLEHKSQQVYVATGGTYPVYVSDENGPIKSGDYITIGSLDGTGVKATPNQPTILGHATSDFVPPKGILKKSGKYNVGQINVTLSVTLSPLFKNTLAIPQPLQKLANSLAGQEVSPLRAYIAIIILLVSSTLSIVLLTVGIRSALVSLGRNPLSRHSILQGMFEVVGASLIIFGGSVVGVYLILRI